MCHLEAASIDQQQRSLCYMSTHMDILLPKFFAQALAQRPQRELARGKDARRHVPPNARCRSSENQRPAVSLCVNRVLLEVLDDLVRERKRPVDVCIDDRLDVRLVHFEERLPHTCRCIVQRGAHLAGPIIRPLVRPDGREDVREVLVAVGLDRERRCLS